MSETALVAVETLTLPFGVLRTLHNGSSEVRVYLDLLTHTKHVGKRLSLLGREDNLITEVGFLREISHANVAQVYVAAEVAGSDPVLQMVEIVMPYYERGSILDAMVKRGERFGMAYARDIGVRALRGLTYLHDRHRILHRDLKPANLFLASDGSLVKIGDFGEAMRMEVDGTADPLLSPQFWTPPESFTGGRYGVQSDIYAMGLTLFEVMAGPFPYAEYEVDRLSRRLAAGKRAVLNKHLSFPPHVPHSLQRIARKAIRPEPSDRFHSADEMLQALLFAHFVDWQWHRLRVRSNGQGV